MMDISDTTPPKKIRKPLSANAEGYLFLSPWLVGFPVFWLFPMVVCIIASFSKWDIVNPMEFIGLANWIKMAQDKIFWKCLLNTFYFVGVSVPLKMILALFLAMAVNQRMLGIKIYRLIYYLPSISAGVVIAIVWIWILNPEYGLMNQILASIGIDGIRWLADYSWAMPSLIFMSLWLLGPIMVIYLAGLQNIPEEMYDAAMVDGARWRHKFFRITLPSISPIILFTLIMNLIESFRIFDQIYVMTKGGPGNQTLVLMLHLYNKAFQDYQMGYASGLAMVGFIITLSLAVVILRFSKSWVYTETEV